MLYSTCHIIICLYKKSKNSKLVEEQKIAEQYLAEFGKLAQTNNTMIIPSDLADIAGMIKSASTVLKDVKKV